MDVAEAVGKYYNNVLGKENVSKNVNIIKNPCKDIGRRLGKSDRWVRQRLTLANAPEKLKVFVRAYDKAKFVLENLNHSDLVGMDVAEAVAKYHEQLGEHSPSSNHAPAKGKPFLYKSIYVDSSFFPLKHFSYSAFS